jgi:hypothetical protein
MRLEGQRDVRDGDNGIFSYSYKVRGGGGSVTTGVRAAGEVFDARDFL